MLKTFDYLCPVCKHEKLDVVRPSEVRTIPCPLCNATMERAWLGKPSSVIGDEVDVEIKHGLCWPDGTPRRFTSKTEINREMKKRGLVQAVEHLGSKGSDRSKHTVRWI